jgi:hypothetical protein
MPARVEVTVPAKPLTGVSFCVSEGKICAKSGRPMASV